jgi:hypothetical protein
MAFWQRDGLILPRSFGVVMRLVLAIVVVVIVVVRAVRVLRVAVVAAL